jgi:transposase InsO family protein
VGTIEGVGRISQPTFIDTYSNVVFAKRYDRQQGRVAADLLHDRVLPFFEQADVLLLRILTDRGSEDWSALHHHQYRLCLAIENIAPSQPTARHPQTNGIGERFHRTLQDAFDAMACARKSTPPGGGTNRCGRVACAVPSCAYPHREILLWVYSGATFPPDEPLGAGQTMGFAL